MSRILVSLVLLALLVTACSALAPAPTPTPTATSTPLPTDTPTPVPTSTATNTPLPPTETPDPILGLLPSGTPESEWKGIPIMPGAINGEGDDEAYRFTVAASVEEVQTYYETELAKLGWSLMANGTGDTGAVMMIFNTGTSPFIPISIIPYGDITLVMIVSSQ